MLPDRRIIELAASRAGFRRATSAMVYIGCWLFAERQLDRPLRNAEDFAAFWEMTVPAAYKRQRTFRDVFPEFRTPSDLVASLEAPETVVGESVDELAASVSCGVLVVGL